MMCTPAFYYALRVERRKIKKWIVNREQRREPVPDLTIHAVREPSPERRLFGTTVDARPYQQSPLPILPLMNANASHGGLRDVDMTTPMGVLDIEQDSAGSKYGNPLDALDDLTITWMGLCGEQDSNSGPADVVTYSVVEESGSAVVTGDVDGDKNLSGSVDVRAESSPPGLSVAHCDTVEVGGPTGDVVAESIPLELCEAADVRSESGIVPLNTPVQNRGAGDGIATLENSSGGRAKRNKSARLRARRIAAAVLIQASFRGYLAFRVVANLLEMPSGLIPFIGPTTPHGNNLEMLEAASPECMRRLRSRLSLIHLSPEGVEAVLTRQLARLVEMRRRSRSRLQVPFNQYAEDSSESSE